MIREANSNHSMFVEKFPLNFYAISFYHGGIGNPVNIIPNREDSLDSRNIML